MDQPNSVTERTYCRTIAEDRSQPEDTAVAAAIIGHVRVSNAGACSCGDPGRLGVMYELHQAQALLALLRRRGWKRGFRLNDPKHWCANCDGVAVGSCAFNPNREADDAAERAAATEEKRP